MCASTVDGGNCVVCAAARAPPPPSLCRVCCSARLRPPPRGGGGEAIVVVNIAHCMGLTLVPPTGVPVGGNKPWPDPDHRFSTAIASPPPPRPKQLSLAPSSRRHRPPVALIVGLDHRNKHRRQAETKMVVATQFPFWQFLPPGPGLSLERNSRIPPPCWKEWRRRVRGRP